MLNDDSNDRRVLARKELARERRQQAYREAKERRANDPRTIAMKEALKARRRELCRQARERKKARASAEKVAVKRRQQRGTDESRAAADAELMKLITLTARGSDSLN